MGASPVISIVMEFDGEGGDPRPDLNGQEATLRARLRERIASFLGVKIG